MSMAVGGAEGEGWWREREPLEEEEEEEAAAADAEDAEPDDASGGELELDPLLADPGSTPLGSSLRWMMLSRPRRERCSSSGASFTMGASGATMLQTHTHAHTHTD